MVLKGPSTELFPDGAPPKPDVKISEATDDVTIDAGSLTAKITTKQYAYGIEFRSKDTNKLLTASGYKAQVRIIAISTAIFDYSSTDLSSILTLGNHGCTVQVDA